VVSPQVKGLEVSAPKLMIPRRVPPLVTDLLAPRRPKSPVTCRKSSKVCAARCRYRRRTATRRERGAARIRSLGVRRFGRRVESRPRRLAARLGRAVRDRVGIHVGCLRERADWAHRRRRVSQRRRRVSRPRRPRLHAAGLRPPLPEQRGPSTPSDRWPVCRGRRSSIRVDERIHASTPVE